MHKDMAILELLSFSWNSALLCAFKLNSGNKILCYFKNVHSKCFKLAPTKFEVHNMPSDLEKQTNQPGSSGREKNLL